MYADSSINAPTEVFIGTEKDVSGDLLGIDASLGYVPESSTLDVRFYPIDAFSNVTISDD